MNRDRTLVSGEMVEFLRACAEHLNISGISDQQLKQRFGSQKK